MDRLGRLIRCLGFALFGVVAFAPTASLAQSGHTLLGFDSCLGGSAGRAD